MSADGWRGRLKHALAAVPGAPELLQRYSGVAPYYSLQRLVNHLPDWVAAVRRARRRYATPDPRRLLIFAYLPWWLEHAVALALFLRSRGHSVKLAYLPYRGWQQPRGRFDDRRQAAYIHRALAAVADEVDVSPLQAAGRLDPALGPDIELQSRLDVQYSLQREDLDWQSDPKVQRLLDLRRSRNQLASAAVSRLLRGQRPDAVVIANGSILEFGAVFRTARHVGQRTVSYEFGEQRQRAWLALDEPVMRLPTDDLWRAAGGQPATTAQLERVSELYAAREGGQRWSRFARQWQRGERQGEAEVRRRLDLSPDLPLVLLCTNVVGDSLALDRQVFTAGMAEWLAETVRAFAGRSDCQLVVRVHPGELLGAGHRSERVIQEALPELPPQVRVVPPNSRLNTYDLIDLAHLGLVYTSTVGLEMAMYGVPVVVSGATHYRGKGFTHDPASLDEYLDTVQRLLADPLGRRLPTKQIELAWRYAYLFFFHYPFPFPWHLINFWDDLARRPLESVVAAELTPDLERTLRALTGEPIDWTIQPPAIEELERA